MNKRRKIVEDYYCDINNLAELICKLVNAYRLLIGGAGELNSIALAKRGDVKHALDRANELGDVIDELICVLDNTSCAYTNYCELKAKVMKCKLEYKFIQSEIEDQIDLKE
ncbi:hypothetical protein [Clostridium rectalis]|uniref:hypothetical protein n=1 Tax=Clostridium rectalis TaxID=2040295 RepID=UPI000F63EC9B|nr:hypothetical protein [Clostridium rectalis]